MYQMQYTAITGAVGVGEAGPVAAPPHPQARALVELLLDAGADPNDEQALYNVHFLRDEGWRELLLARGLRERMRLDYLLGASVKQGFTDRVALLLAHGASPNGRDFYNKRTHIENALLMGPRSDCEDARRSWCGGVVIFPGRGAPDRVPARPRGTGPAFSDRGAGGA
jgi:hypothetical protein